MLAEEGVRLVIADRQDEKGTVAARAIQQRGGTALFVRTDVSRRAEVNALIATTLQAYGQIDILCNIAGPGAQGGQLETTEAELDRQLIGNFFLAFASALVIAALLAWKTELVTFSSKLTVAEIRGTLLLGFITVVIHPLLPDRFIDPWKVLNPRSVWLSVVIVSGLSFVNYVLLRQFGTRGIHYNAILGGLVNSAATAALLGQEVQDDASTVAAAPTDVVLSDLAMILRNWALVVIFSFPQGLRASISTVIVLVPMMLATGMVALFAIWGSRRSRQKASHHPEREAPQQLEQEASQKRRLKSPLELRSVLGFGVLFLLLTVISGVANRLFGAIGFLAVVVAGALASTASSSVLVGQQLGRGQVAGSSAAIAMFLATLVGLLENIVIFWFVTRKPDPSLRLVLLTTPIVLVGILAVVIVTIFGW